MYIYLITCLPTGKYYVGQHVGDPLPMYFGRKYSAGRKSKLKNHLFHRFQKYTKTDFIIEQLALADTQAQLNNLERVWIAALDCRNDNIGMNMTAGGEVSWLGLRHTEESKAKMSASLKGMFSGEKNHNFGKTHSPETRKKLGDGNRGRKFSDEWLENMRLAQIGRTHSAETKAKMSESAKRRWAKGVSEEARKRMSESQKKRFVNGISEEERKNRSDAQKLRFAKAAANG